MVPRGDAGAPAILHVSIPASEDRTGIPDEDPWLNECWLLNITGASGTFTVRIEDVSGSISSYHTHLVIALNDAAYNNLDSLSVDNNTIVKNDFKYGMLRPCNLRSWPSGDVYPTWFNDTLVNVGTIPPKGHTDVTVSVAFSNATGARVHFDAYGSTKSSPTPPTKKCYITRNPLSEDSTVLFWPPPAVQYYLTVKTAPLGVVTISGEGWYDNCTYVNLTATESVLVSPGVKYRFHHWDVDGANVSGNPITVHMDANHTATAHYALQYYLAVISPYGTPSGEGWYNNCTDAYAALDASTIDHGNGTRRVFAHWSGDSSGTTYARSDPVHMDGPKTATANWKTQHQLIVRTNGLGTNVTKVYNGTTILGTATDATPYINWFDEGSTLQLNVDSPITVGPTMFVFTQWSGDAHSISLPLPLTLDSPTDITANYKTLYEVTFSQFGVGADFTGTVVTIDETGYNVTDLPVSFWWNKNSQHNFSFTSPLVVNASRQYVWLSTSGLSSSQNDMLTITGPGSVTGYYSTEVEYEVTFDQTGVDSDFNGTIVVIDGTPYGGTALPVSFWWDFNSIHTFAFQSPLVVIPNAKQYVWNSTSGLSQLQSGSINVSISGNVVGNFKTQFYLTVISPYDTPNGEGWYDKSTDAFANLATGTVDHGNETRRVFANWSVDASGNAIISDPIHMDGPKTALANWKTQYLLMVHTDPTGLSLQPTRSPAGEAGPSGWWYDSSTNVQLAAQPVMNYAFLNWDVDTIKVSGNPITVSMDGPHVATAHYQKAGPPPAVGGSAVSITLDLGASSSFFLQIGLDSVLSTIVATTIILIRRRKKALKWKH